MLIFTKEDLLFDKFNSKELKQTKLFRSLIILLLFVNGLGALFAGYGFILEPNGSFIGLDKSILIHSPFHDFLIPGISLLIFNGLSSLYVLWQFAKKTSIANCSLFIQGLLSCGWITIQVIMLRSFNFLHVIFGIIGLAFLISGYQLIKRKLR